MARRRNSKSGCIGWAVVIFLGFGLINSMCSKHDLPKPAPTPVAYVPTAAERAVAAKQAASDAKFWAAKNAKEQTEVNAYNKAQEPLRDARADAAAEIYRAQAAAAARNAELRARAEQGTTRVGAVCKDGTNSGSTGSGACSGHGGVKTWLYN